MNIHRGLPIRIHREDVNLAVQAAVAALNSPTWGYKSTGAQRAVILRKLGTLLEARKDELARLDSLDQGKPFREGQADLGDAISACNHFADLAEEQDSHQEVYEDILFMDRTTTHVHTFFALRT
jgi:betaine-aldehyde dehydrogenase